MALLGRVPKTILFFYIFYYCEENKLFIFICIYQSKDVRSKRFLLFEWKIKKTHSLILQISVALTPNRKIHFDRLRQAVRSVVLYHLSAAPKTTSRIARHAASEWKSLCSNKTVEKMEKIVIFTPRWSVRAGQRFVTLLYKLTDES